MSGGSTGNSSCPNAHDEGHFRVVAVAAVGRGAGPVMLLLSKQQ